MTELTERLATLQTLVHSIILCADDNMSRHTWRARDAFIDITDDAEKAEKIVIQLQKETSQ